ncbi:hypothetical protein HK104_008544 [Borealophlyctis nickersoniae]|nr:hypothetical protein HK104_008544 [Borealophlyctis nickersoniae]
MKQKSDSAVSLIHHPHADLIPSPTSTKKRPSEYIKEHSLTTAERLAQASYQVHIPKIVELVGDPETAVKNCSDMPIDRPLFEAFPSMIVLQNYVPFQEYEIIVNFRNNDKVGRRLKIEPIDNPYFSVTGWKTASLNSGKVAPGMEIPYILRFTPEKTIDYSYNLVCTTDREKFLVPIRAIGARALLDFPDSIVFSDAPVNYKTTKTLLVRNIGNRPAKFVMTVEPPFSTVPTCGYLEVKESMQIDVEFYPEHTGSFEKELCITYDTGDQIVSSLLATSEDANIRLEKSTLRLDNTYISLSSMKSVRICNRSDIMAKFQWKRFATAAEERQYRMRREAELANEQDQEVMRLKETWDHIANPEGPDLSVLAQKYKNLTREMHADPLTFTDPIFRLEPISSTIWPNSFVDINVFFTPDTAGTHPRTVYCEVEGREMRLPLYLKGDGIGPKARFSYDLLDAEDLFINTVHKYEVLLENRGEIDVTFSLIPSASLFGPKFTFEPTSGELKVGEQTAIEVTFRSDILGEFEEEFKWALKGSPEPLLLSFKGRVVGPTFHFDTPTLNFRKISYGFTHTRTITLVNTSHISMTYNLRIPTDGVDRPNEFRMEPSRGTIPPLGSEKIRMDFTPAAVMVYETFVAVDVEDVGEELFRLPIYAQSIVPEISLLTLSLDYGDCFLNYPYTQTVELENPTDYPARYNLLSQEESARSVYAYASKSAVGIIAPHSRQHIPVDVHIKRLGQINFPIFIKIDGNEQLPLGVDISGSGIGPNIIISTTEVNWGKIPVLKETVSSLTVTNDSPIPANFTCATVSEISVFRVEPASGCIQPGGVAEITVTAYLDDCLKFTDILKISVQSAGTYEVQLVARGQGTTIVFDEALKNVDFKDVFSNRECSREFTLVNKGRRAQTLHWAGDEKRFALKDTVAEDEQLFEVFPARFTLKPGGQQIIIVKGYSDKAMKAKETLMCLGTIDKDPARRQIVEMVVTANFINPLVEMTPNVLNFKTAHTRDEDVGLLTQELSLKNVSSLPLHISFRCPVPYSIEPSELDHRLNPDDVATVVVRYDPSYNTDRLSCKDHAKLVITYSEHPRKDVVELFSQVSFPNLTFSASSVHFGCIPIDTEQKRTFVMSNGGTLPVAYCWSFLEDSVQKGSSSSHIAEVDNGTASEAQPPMHQVFDVLPLRGLLQPGETEQVEVTFYGYLSGRFNATALCDVTGGPKYEVNLQGEASLIQYQFDRYTIDFGTQLYQDILEQEIILSNVGQVVFDFNTIIFPSSSLAQKIMVSPASGSILPHAKQRITVRFCIMVPEVVDDYLYIQIAHFEPVPIKVVGNGIFPRITVNLPRAPDERYDALLAEVRSTVTGKKPKHSSSVSLSAVAAENSTVALPDAEVEAEAERFLLREKTGNFLHIFGEEVRARTPPVPKGRFIGSPILFHRTLQKNAKDRKHHCVSESSSVELAKYICDFGNVIRNTHKKKVIRVTNRGIHPVSFSLDKSLLTGTGFTIEPDKVKMLPGAPHNESVDFQVTFQARSLTGELGPAEIKLPINVTGGPTTVIILRADVTVPTLQLSTHEANFGEVLCGRRKTVTIQMFNSNTVPCEWTSVVPEIIPPGAKKAKKKPGASTMKEFELVPAFGTLQPGEKSLVMVRFSPTEEKDYDEVLPIKITMNAKSIPLHLFGKGVKPTIVFEPETLVIGPILPASEGVESRIFVHNPTNYAVEMYSIEFDQQYLEEEEILKRVDGYENGAIFLPPREPGNSLPDHIVEVAAAKLKQEKLLKESAGAEGGPKSAAGEGGVGDLVDTPTGAGVGSVHGKHRKSYAALPQLPQKPGDGAGIVSLAPPSPDAGAATDYPHNVIIHGPPFSGRTTQARRVCKAFGHVYIRVDDIIEASSAFDATHGDKAVRTVPAASTGGLPGGIGVEGEEHSSSVARDDDPESAQSEHYDTFEQHAPIPEDMLVEVLKTRFQKDDCVRGIVIDGLESKYCTNPTVLLRAILRSLAEKGRRTIFFHLTVDPVHIRDREISAMRAINDKEAEALQVREVSEEEYDKMTDLEKEQYDRVMLKSKRKMKELQERKKLERKRWEEELAMRLGERKPEEDGKMAKGKKVKGKVPTVTRGFEKSDKTAPSPGSRSEAKLSKNNISDLKTGMMSPKIQKKPFGDRMDKAGEKGDRSMDKDKMEKEGEDLSSRFTLSEGADVFLNETTHRRYETYSSTLESVMGLLKDGDKPAGGRQAANVNTPDKKSTKAKLGQGAGAGYDMGASTMTMSLGEELHASEDNPPTWQHDVTGTGDEESVFRNLSEFIPTASSLDDNKDQLDAIPPPFTEQIVYFPAERADAHPQSRYFTLLPPIVAAENEEDVGGSGEGPPTTATGVPATTPSTAPGNGNAPARGDFSRKSRQPIKIFEDAKTVVETEDDGEKEDIKRMRWIIQPHERKELIVRFSSNEIGRFEQTLSFELVGARGRYSLHCVGHCQYSHIISDPKKVFQKWRKNKEEKTIVHGEYVASTGVFEFGPLLYSKPREKYLERFPENRGLLSIANPGPQEIKVNISLKNDVKGDVFFFDPPSMDLAPGQSQNLSIWAYPRSNNHFEDTIVICVKDNPEPYCFKISCIGVKPELEIDKKLLSFDKMLLGRAEKREIKLKNGNLLPVAWKIVGVDALGDEFQVAPTEGLLDSYQECTINAEFKGTKPVVVKRVVRLEVSDVDKIGGVVQEVPILVTAEAYDIAMDLHFPKGYEGGLDFGVLKVFEEGKQMCTLKNKGKYEVGYRFNFDNKEFNDLFTVSPQQGIMQPSDKPFPVQFLFKTNREMHIKDNTCCKCQFYEPTTGEVTATIPVKLSARAVFSKFSILPVRDLNFGALVHGTKATRQFVVDNLGEFDFRYSIYKMLPGTQDNKLGNKLRTASRASKTGGRSTSPPSTRILDRKAMVKQADALNFGAFTVFPTSGIVPAGTKQQITVEFHSDTPGSFEETAAIDVTDRSPIDYADVLEYRLIGESCIPGINTTDFASIFEEHAVCKRLDMFNTQGNVYAEDDRVFYFGAYLAGQQAQVRFKIANPYKIPCDVTLSTRPRSKTKSDAADFAFDLDPKKLSIPSHEHRYVTVSFHPTSIQSYAGIFEAVVDNVGESKSKTLMFELRGEGTLPRVTVDKPSTKNKNGVPIMKFRRLLIGSAQTLPVVLRNEGIIPAKVKLEWVYKDTDDFECASLNTYHVMRPQDTRTIDVRCRASSIRKMEAELKLRVVDNSFEDTSIILQGEGYLDDITFDNLPEGAENEVLFGDCYINEMKQVEFTVTNHSHEYVRIAFAEHADFTFNPSSCHIRPKGGKQVTVSFLPKQPTDLRGVAIPVKLVKIRYTAQPPDVDWDDRMKAVRWVISEGGKGVAPKKVLEQFPEPAHDVIAPSANDHTLTVTAFADYSTYECDVSDVTFKSTLMFQTRVYHFSLHNTGKVLVRYHFIFYGPDNTPVEPGDEECPFSVTPSSGTIDPDETLMVSLRFGPTDVANYSYTLVCAMPNLAAGQKQLQVHVAGFSLRPFCHFELEESDYITSERRNVEASVSNGLPSVLEAGTRVIEFASCGVKVKNTKRFYLVNPTGINYNFEWVTDTLQAGRVFRCLTPKGLVMSGKKYEMVFEFLPESVDLKEALWRFIIAGHGISIPFLLVGQAVEPNVFMDKASVNFKSLLVGRQVKDVVKLVNNEDIPFSFAFNETSSELGNDGTPVLRFSPTAGTIGAKSEIPIEIVFVPSAEKVFNFNLVCHVRKKPAPVTINVKGEGYEIHESLQSELGDGTMFELAPKPNPDNVIDFGLVQINEKRLKRVAIINSGKFNFDFSWKFLSKSGGVLSVNPEIGTVPRGDRVHCEIAFVPTTTTALKNVKAVCQIVNGRSYPVTIMGGGSRPLLKFSKTTHDFGKQFVYRPGVTPAVASIQITNEDVKDISFDVVFPESPAFDVQRGPSTLAAGETTTLDVTFYPREARSYSETIKVEINGLSTVDLNVTGEGAEFRVEPMHAHQRSVNFGAVRVGHAVTRSIKIINRSSIPATFTLGPAATLENLSAHCVTMSHQGECTLRPKGILNVELKFQPQQRIPPFSEEVSLEAPGLSKPLFVVVGACQGIDVKLENDTLPFGAVVQKSTTTRRMQLQNVGDIGAKFHWDAAKFGPDFSITPSEGYISPGMDISLEITFHPTEINPDIRYENLVCTVEGSPPLYLTLTGMCVAQPVQNEVIKFSCPVRQSDVKGIPLTNKTSAAWHIRPVIENEYWSGPETVDIEPGQTKSYDLVFTPLEMTGDGDGGRHEGSVFFPLPDGSGTLYKLYGTADKPVTAGTITREIPCKTSYTEIIPVTNWLKRPQRFKVTIEFAKPDPSVILRGHDFIDVPALLTKEYKCSFYAYKEGVTSAKIIFKNETTQEFLFYNLTFKSTAPGVISTFEMTTTVRQLCMKEVTIVNPLAVPVTFTTACGHADVTLPHSFTIQPKAEATCPIELLPLHPRESTTRISLTSAELGLYQYDLKLVSTPAGPERSLHFKVGLGGSQTQLFRFQSFAKTKTEYVCKVDSPDFTVEKSVVAASAPTGGTELTIDVTYEPSKLGDTRTQLLVSSPAGGDYICPLYGHCIAPRPQGPILIKPGSSASVPFKNVFSGTATFHFNVDNPAFQVKAAETIGAKKTVSISIGYKQTPGGSASERGGDSRGGDEGGALSGAGGGTSSSTGGKEGSSQQLRRERAAERERTAAEREKGDKGSNVVLPGIGKSGGGGHTAATTTGSSSKVGKLTITHAGSNVTWIYYLKVGTS